MVKINANSYTPVNNESIPTGNLDLLIYSIYLSNYILQVWKFSFFETHFFPEITLRKDRNGKGYCMIQKKKKNMEISQYISGTRIYVVEKL